MHKTGYDFRLGDWTVRPQRRCIERGDELVRLKPKCMAVLETLAGADGNVVSRNQLFDSVWPGGVVSDDALTQCVVELRKAFGDTARNPQVIETIPKTGLRLLPAVVPLAAGPDISSMPASNKTGWRPALQFAVFGAGTVLLAMSLFVYLSGSRDRSIADANGNVKSIAVLPFVDMSPDKDQKYFADGLSEELINKLTRLEGLQVTGRTSSFYFKDRNEDLRVVGERLNVGHILEGSVRKAGNQLRITAQLVDVASGYHLWSDTYDRPLADIFAIQEQIADAVSAALSIKLSVGPLGNLVGGTTNVDAYDAVMRGNSLYREFTADSILQAVEQYKQAVRIDPEFALGWERLADIYRNAWLVFGSEESQDWQQRSDDALRHAMRLAPTSPYILKTAAFAQVAQGDWAGVERTLSIAGQLDSSVDFRFSGIYADLLIKIGRAGEAIAIKERARRLDPLHPGTAMYLGHMYATQGRIDDALTELERGVALGDYLPQLSVEGMVTSLAADDKGLLRKWLARAIRYQQPGARGTHDAMLELLDDREGALRWLREAFASSPSTDYYVVLWASYFGDPDLAMRAMQRSPDPWAFWSPVTAELRRRPEFKEIVRDAGMVAYWKEFGWGDFCRPLGGEDFECS